MSSNGTPWKFPDVTDLAETLGAILVEKLNDTLRDAIAMEATVWRTDAMRILTQLQQDARYHFVDANAEECSHQSSFESNLKPSHSRNSCDEQSDSSSVTPLPFRSLNRISSLEGRLAVEVFTAKFSQTCETNNRREEVSPIGSGAARSTDLTNRVPFEALIPSAPANIDHLPGELAVESFEELPPQESLFTRDVSSSSASSSAYKPRSPRNCALSPIVSEDTLDTGSVAPRPLSEREPAYESSSSHHRSDQWKIEAKKFYDNPFVAAPEARRQCRWIICTMFRVLGIIPWRAELSWLSGMYQIACVCLIVMSTSSVVTDSFALVRESEPTHHDFVAHVDDVVVVGTLLSFLAVLWNNQALHDTAWLIESYLLRAGRLEKMDDKTWLQIMITVVIWSMCVGSRLYANAFALDSGDFGFAFNLLVLLVVGLYALRLCRGLLHMVDDFCWYMQYNSRFEDALQEFYLLHCTIRTACNSLQLTFVVFQLIATLLFLLNSAVIYFGHMTTELIMLAFIPGLSCLMILLQLLISAGFVSDMCDRVPMLVNSVNAKLEFKRMYVVDYIVNSQVGFYVFGMRLSTATLLKLFYVAFVAWCGVLTQGILK